MRNLVNQSKSSVLNSPEQAQTQALFVYAKLFCVFYIHDDFFSVSKTLANSSCVSVVRGACENLQCCP